MTKFQQEKDTIFSGVQFSEQKIDEVVNAMAKKPRRNLIPAFAFIGVAVVAMLLFLLPSNLFETKHAFTEQSFEQAYHDIFTNDDGNQILYTELNRFEDNDAIVIVRYRSESDEYFILRYAKFEENEWKFYGSTSVDFYDEEQQIPYQELLTNLENESIFFGAFRNGQAPNRVIVGKEDAELIKIKNVGQFFVEKANSSGTPVYFVKKNTRERVTSYGMRGANSLPVLEESENDFVIMAGDEMLGAYDTFYDYWLIVDPTAYENAEPKSGDVVYIRNPQTGDKVLTRIITDGNNAPNVAVTEGSILLNGYGNFLSVPYMIAHFNGESAIYDNSNPRSYVLMPHQYFAKSDNWGSQQAHEGIIIKEDIIGKVKGYSLMMIEVNWPVEVLKGYDDFRAGYDAEVLKHMEPVQIALMQKFAEYVGDYRTVFELFGEEGRTRTYEDWSQMINLDMTKSMKQRILYEADLLVRAGSFNEKKQRVEHIHPITGETKYAVNMVKENGAWKIKYETVINLNY